MHLTLADLFRDITALGAGVIIGLAFGTLQQIALRREGAQAPDGRPKSGWALLPSAVVRLVFLLSTLGLIRLACPLLFADGSRWLISAGVVLGYGSMLFGQLRRRVRAASALNR